MSKTIFDPNAKTMKVGEPSSPEPKGKGQAEEASAGKSSFSAHGASEWKAFSTNIGPFSTPPSPLEEIGGFTSAFGDIIKETIDEGPVGGSPLFTPIGPFDLRGGTMKGKEYTKYFSEVTSPPSLAEALAVAPKVDNKSLKEELRTHYENFMNLLLDRKANIERGLSGGRFSAEEHQMALQFLKDLDSAIWECQENLKGVDKLNI